MPGSPRLCVLHGQGWAELGFGLWGQGPEGPVTRRPAMCVTPGLCRQQR